MNKGYESLAQVLDQALKQASEGKGKARHAEENQAFEDQLIMVIEKLGVGFQLGQAIKKIVESCRLEPTAAKNELYGAINYIAAKAILLDAK